MPFVFRPGSAEYHQIKEDLLAKMARGIFTEKLPPETQLAREYGVSRPTVRQALLELVREGTLTRARGRGTFLTRRMITSDAQTFQSFTDEMRQQGVPHHVSLIAARTLRATGAMASELQIPDGASVHEVVRLFSGNGEPLVLRTSQIPAHLCPGLLHKNLQVDPLYGILANDYGLRPAGNVLRFSAVPAFREEAGLLEVDLGAPLMLWRGVIYGADSTPLVRTKALYRGDRYQFSLRQGSLSSEESLLHIVASQVT